MGRQSRTRQWARIAREIVLKNPHLIPKRRTSRWKVLTLMLVSFASGMVALWCVR